MNALHLNDWLFHFRPKMSRLAWLTGAISVCMTLSAGNVAAQLAPNQTHGFGNGRVITFT